MSYIGNNPSLKSIVSTGDTLANLTAEARRAGRLVYATDTQLYYYDDGTSLTVIGSPPDVGDFGFKVYLNTGQNITTTAQQVIQFDAEAFDRGGFWNTTTNRFQPNVAGAYQFNLQWFASNLVAGSGDVRADITLNGTTKSRIYANPLSISANSWSGSTSVVIEMNGTTDYVDFVCASGSDSNYDLPASETLCNASGFRISAK